MKRPNTIDEFGEQMKKTNSLAEALKASGARSKDDQRRMTMRNLSTLFRQIEEAAGEIAEIHERQEMEAANRPTRKTDDEIKIWLDYLRRFYTDDEIAQVVGVKKRQLRRWETGESKPRPHHRRNLKEFYLRERRKHR